MKTLHVIPHAHWDREWYMPFEDHRYRLVELFDNILKAFETDKDFKYYHMDGQVIPVLDYLQVKPNNTNKIKKLIKENKLQVGPWYVLQDEFLTSGESQIRNMQLGMKITRQLGGEPVMTGYFPDSFGNMSQAPQILNKFDIHTAFFGRGLNEVGFDNQVIEQKGINKSELNWESPDGSKVASCLFANWYCNANDLPDKTDLDIKDRFQNIIDRALPFSQIDDLLGMNGCDHSPLQSNLPEIISRASNMFKGKYNIIFSNIKNYAQIIYDNRHKYKTFKGEINGQLTTGYNLLLNTASTRIDIKKLNHDNENKMIFETEPISVLDEVFMRNKYPLEYIEYFWRTLIQNHPHDSACSCNIDPVNAEIKVRHMKAGEVANTLCSEAIDRLGKGIRNFKPEHQITIYNKDCKKADLLVKAYVDFDIDDNVKNVYVTDSLGDIINVATTIERNKFTYTLPKNSFRKVRYVDRVHIEFVAKNIPGLGLKSYHVIKDKENKSYLKNDKSNVMENDFIKLTFNNNGSFDMLLKEKNHTFTNQNYFELTYDVGNEYNYEQSKDGFVKLTLDEKPKITKTYMSKVKEEILVEYTLSVPKGVKDKVVTTDKTDLKIKSTITLYKDLKYPIIQTKVFNKCENFRLRAMFDTNIKSQDVYSCGQFDLVKRDLFPWEGWKNPSNCGRSDGFVTFKDDKVGQLVSGHGLYEYEVVRQDKKHPIALTILKGIDQLGDWGVFPSPDSQMKGEITLEYIVYPYDVNNSAKTYADALNFYHGTPRFSYTKPSNFKGKIAKPEVEILSFNNDNIILSAFKKAETDKHYLLRVYSLSDKEETAKLTFNFQQFKKIDIVNLNEKLVKELPLSNLNEVEVKFKPKEILTFKVYRKF